MIFFIFGLVAFLYITKTAYVLPLVCSCALFFTGGMARFLYEKTTYDALFTQPESYRYRCTGTVNDIIAYPHPYFKKRITVATDTLTCTTDPSIVLRKTVFIYVYVPVHDVSGIDDAITVSHIAIKKPKNSSDLIKIMRSSVVASLFCSDKKYSIQKATHYSLRHYMFDIRAQTVSALCKHIKEPTQAFYTSLFLGNKTDKPIHIHTVSLFSIWGINHHLARSGLHLVIIMWLWFLCIQRIPIRNASKYLVCAALGIIYYVLSWPSVSFDRACLSYALYKGCSWNHSPLDPMHAISLVILLFLLFSPAHLLCLDFQLSFGLTYALAWFNHAHTKIEIQ